jgi:hypothetical protein
MSWRIGKTRQRGLKKSAEELRMGIPALRQYIDATMSVAPIGNGVQICSVYNFQILFRGFFSSVCRALPNDAGWFSASIGEEKKNIDLMAAFRLFGRPLPFCFTGAETEIDKIKDDGKNWERNEPRSPQSEPNWDSLTHSWPPYFLIADYL